MLLYLACMQGIKAHCVPLYSVHCYIARWVGIIHKFAPKQLHGGSVGIWPMSACNRPRLSTLKAPTTGPNGIDDSNNSGVPLDSLLANKVEFLGLVYAFPISATNILNIVPLKKFLEANFLAAHTHTNTHTHTHTHTQDFISSYHISTFFTRLFLARRHTCALSTKLF